MPNQSTVKNDGGSAFPNGGEHASGMHEGGMSLRDYFAAHAPGQIAGWFKHVPLPESFPAMPKWEELPARHQKAAQDWLADQSWDLEGALAPFQDAVDMHAKGKTAWREQDAASRYVQWRWAYADAMIAERDR